MNTQYKRIFSMISAAAVTLSLLAGCAKSAGPTDSASASTAASLSASDGVAAADLANTVKEKYATDETVAYTDGQFEVARDSSFLVQYDFDPIAAGMDSYPQIAALYADQALTQEIPATYDWADDSKHSYTISPWKTPRTEIAQAGLDSSTPGYTEGSSHLFDRGAGKDWGNYSTMYLAQWVDLQTGEKLSKPIVSVVTVKGELDTPQVRLTATDDGIGEFSWSSVPGATQYLVLEIPVNSDGSTGQASVIGQTEQTSWSGKVEEDTVTGSTWLANSRFANYIVSEDDWLSQDTIDAYQGEHSPADGPVHDSAANAYYTVVAVNDTGCSMFGKLYANSEIAATLPHTLAYNMEKQSAQGFQSYVDGVDMMPAYRWIVMCDGTLAQRLVNYDMGSAVEDEETLYTYEKDDMSDMKESVVPVLKIPYVVEGTPFSGTLTVENYDADRYEQQLQAISDRQESLRNRSGAVEQNVSVQPQQNSAAESQAAAASETAASQGNNSSMVYCDDPITANSALSEYLAANMISSNTEIDLSQFPEAGDPQYLADAWEEAIYQNPLVLGVSAAGISDDRGTLYIQYQESAEQRTQQQQELREAVAQISSSIIDPSMSDRDKEFAINQYLCENGEYDDAALENAEQNDFLYVDSEYYDSFTAYGILVNKVGVCASYSAAFKMLADAAGLNSIVVTGYLEGSTPHAWNRVNLNGNWDTLDVTNNDMDYMSNMLLNLPDSALPGVLVEDESYAIDSALADYVSMDTDSEYYKVNGAYYSQDEIAQQFADQLQTESTVVLRTDYNLTDEQFYKIGRKVVELTGDTNLGGCYWMGTILLTTDTQ